MVLQSGVPIDSVQQIVRKAKPCPQNLSHLQSEDELGQPIIQELQRTDQQDERLHRR